MTVPNQHSPVHRIIEFIVKYPKTHVLLSLLLMIVFFTALPSLYKDTRADAFLADDNPALVYRNKVKEQFGLSDPIVIAVVNRSQHGVFNPGSLALVDWLSNEISALNNINADRVTSLTTQNNITGSEVGMDVEPFFEDVPDTQAAADAIWSKVVDFPLYMGNLVAKDKLATLVVAELLDESKVEATYQQILAIVDKAPKSAGDVIHVTGEGAVSGFMGSYIDADAQRLNPLAGLIITLIILFAFRRFSPGLLANVIIMASVLMTLSVMAASGVAFFVITNALPVILIGISVADSIHIYSLYFELQAKHPQKDKIQIIIQTMTQMWRPITLTTLTTIAGFIGLYFAAYMPPFKYFGLFTAVGVAIAWLYSLVFLPAALAIIKPSASNYMVRLAKNNEIDPFSRAMVVLGRLSLNNAKSIIAIAAVVIVSGLLAASYIQVNEDRIATFHPDEPLYQADKAINKHFNGSNNIDIVIEANETEALFEPQNLAHMEALQNYALTLPHVNGATSIVDYLKQINRSLNGGAQSAYVLPLDKTLVAQYFLIYSASSDPADFEEEVDYDYRVANIRLTLNSGSFIDSRHVVEQLQNYIDNQFNTSEINATLSGRVTVNYHWIKDLGQSHFMGVAISMFLVWAVAAMLFGSLMAGLFAIIPVAGSILLVYAAMVVLKIDLGIGTSMFASVAIGLGVDFAIHTIDRLRSLYQENNGDWDKTMAQFYPTTGRALFFNYLAIACGFGVLISSKVVPLNNFGIIVIVSVTTSFLASLSLLPALIKVFKPEFITGTISNTNKSRQWVRISSVILTAGLVGSLVYSHNVQADELPNADEVVAKVNAVDDGQFVTRDLKMTLTDKRGKSRVRETFGYRKYYGSEKKTILFYKKPTNVKGTAFLTFDYSQTDKDDDQWLYLPALRKVRRISSSDRGDYFLGTDFTFEDIKLENKLEPTDYQFKTVKLEKLGSYNTVLIEGTPKSRDIAKELGYGRTAAWVNLDNWTIVKANYWDTKGKSLKTIDIGDIRVVDGILTRHQMTVDNKKTGHKTQFVFSNVDYQTPVKDSMFSKRAMKRGK
jgi:predicted RND superfamily exporter protein